MGWLLNLAYLGLLFVCSPWLVYSAWRDGKYRHGWSAKFWGMVPASRDPANTIWLHAVSLGEVNLLSVLLDELSRREPRLQFYITTTTLTGYGAACRRYAPRHQVSYAPLDFTWAVRRALRHIRPRLLVLAELELWPNLISAAHDSGTRVAIVNGRLSERSWRGYRRLRPIMRRLVQKLDLIAVQTAEYARRFADLGARTDQLVVTGSMKFDGAPLDRGNRATRRLAELADVRETETIWLAGSTFPPEEQLLLSVFARLAVDWPELRLILVPRHPERFDEVAALLQRSGLPFARRSQLPRAAESERPRVLLVDAMGELAAWWGLAQIGFVGGSLGKRGGQNMIEPAGYGVAICFGPRTENFRDVVQAMLDAQAATVVHDAADLEKLVRQCLEVPSWAVAQGERATALVLQNLGAAGRTAEQLIRLLTAAEPSVTCRSSDSPRAKAG
jgi:3-deoxy-D-manno-octulosonic-acid transferase